MGLSDRIFQDEYWPCSRKVSEGRLRPPVSEGKAWGGTGRLKLYPSHKQRTFPGFHLTLSLCFESLAQTIIHLQDQRKTGLGQVQLEAPLWSSTAGPVVYWKEPQLGPKDLSLCPSSVPCLLNWSPLNVSFLLCKPEIMILTF